MGPKRLHRLREMLVSCTDVGITLGRSPTERTRRFSSTEATLGHFMFVLTADHGEEFLDHGRSLPLS
jgi:hypothetical protein